MKTLQFGIVTMALALIGLVGPVFMSTSVSAVDPKGELCKGSGGSVGGNGNCVGSSGNTVPGSIKNITNILNFYVIMV